EPRRAHDGRAARGAARATRRRGRRGMGAIPRRQRRSRADPARAGVHAARAGGAGARGAARSRRIVPAAELDPGGGAARPGRALARAVAGLGRLGGGDRIVTLSADGAVTTHLAAWINRKGVYFPRAKPEAGDDAPQAVRWRESPSGQHIELGIAEHNLFLALGA